MKYIPLIIIILIFMNFSCSTSKKIEVKEKPYKVSKIEHINSYFFIYCENNDNKYKIISKETNENLLLKKIAIGNTYKFRLFDFPNYSNEKNPLGGYTSLENCFWLDKYTKICKDKGIGLYTTNNLKGLYIVK